MHLKAFLIFNALSDTIKDGLIVLDEPKTLDELVSLAVQIDNQLRQRSKEKTKGNLSGKPFTIFQPTSQSPPPSPVHSESEPMQIGRTLNPRGTTKTSLVQIVPLLW